MTKKFASRPSGAYIYGGALNTTNTVVLKTLLFAFRPMRIYSARVHDRKRTRNLFISAAKNYLDCSMALHL